MKKLKLFFAACALLLGCSNAMAQKDVTSQYITNANLSSLTGWTNTNFNTPVRGNNTAGYASECWAGNPLAKTSYSLLQTITLPAGNYQLVNYSFYRYSWGASDDPTKSLAYLKAGENKVAIKTLGSITASGYANSQAEGANCFDSKMYRNTVNFTIAADNTPIEIGIYGTHDAVASWVIAGMFELINLDEPATMDSPFDVTGYITNPGAEYRDMSGWTLSEEGALETQNNNQTFKVGGYYFQKWQPSASGALTARSMSQTLTGLPAGLYRLTANLGGDGSYVSLGDGTTTKTTSWTADGDYTASLVLEDGKDLIVTAGKTAEGTANWIHFDNFKLKFCGDVQAALTTVLNAANDILTGDAKLSSTVKSNLQTAYNTYNTSYTDVDLLLAAIDAMQTAVDNAQASIDVYEDINTAISSYATKADALDKAGAAAYNASGIQTKYDSGTYETLAEAQTELQSAFAVAVKAQTTADSDWTGLIVNNSFESDFSNGWTNNGMARQSNNSFGKTGTYYAEKWEPNGTFGVTQTIAGMPTGVYKVSAHSKARGVTSAKIFAAGIDKAITIADSEGDYSVEFACDDNADVTIGFEGVGTGAGSSWLCVDNFTMTLVSAGLPDVEAVEGKMNAEVAQAQANAIATYNANRTVANYNAAVAAISAAQASKDAYAVIVPHFTKIDAAIVAAETATVGTDDYDAIKTAYDNGTIADNEIQANIKAAYDAVIPVIKSQTAASADFTFAIRNYSFEYGDLTGWTVEASSDTGVRETSNGNYAATGSDGSYLFNTWWKGNPLTQTVENLPNGKYTLTASVASDGATIYLIANGDHNEGTETDGTYPTKDTFQEATFNFLVKDGTATIGVVGGADGEKGVHKEYVPEGYWWYKADNFRLVKTGNLDLELSEDVMPSHAAGEYASITLTRTIKAGFNTLVVPFSITQEEVEAKFGTGSVVYELSSFDGDVIHFQTAEGVKANTPCILKAVNDGSEYTFTGREVEEATSAVATTGAVTFNGSYAASFTVPANDENYVINGGKLYNVNSAVTIKGTRAYLSVVGNQAREISFDGVTGISTVESGEFKKAFTGDIFDLTGRKVKNPSNGIFVVEGKKVVF